MYEVKVDADPSLLPTSYYIKNSKLLIKSLKNTIKRQRLSLVCNFGKTNFNELQIDPKKNQREKVKKTPSFHITEPHTSEVLLIRLHLKERSRT